jgi:hypothetical protein
MSWLSTCSIRSISAKKSVRFWRVIIALLLGGRAARYRKTCFGVAVPTEIAVWRWCGFGRRRSYC